ncbi:MAG: hypothetical protein KBE23_02840 [Chloroflexi bacterium]|nr:hypothetical protein [Chloroflexota bacterium]MBP7041649.1 hypothetical protein [Chloroflexota bacterium]
MNQEEYIENVLISVFLQAREQFGNAIKSYWFYESDSCPSCGYKLTRFKKKREDMLSINTFIYRQRGVLIGYFLCGRCAQKVHLDAKRNPGVQTSVHDRIEETLVAAYHKHMNALM